MRQDATNEPHHHGSCIICIYSDFQAELSYYVWSSVPRLYSRKLSRMASTVIRAWSINPGFCPVGKGGKGKRDSDSASKHLWLIL